MSSFSRQPQINTNPAALITCEQEATQQTLELNNNKIARTIDNAAKKASGIKNECSVKSPNINKPDTNTQTNQETTKTCTNQTKTNKNTLKPEEPVLKRQSTFDELPTGQRDILRAGTVILASGDTNRIPILNTDFACEYRGNTGLRSWVGLC